MAIGMANHCIATTHNFGETISTRGSYYTLVYMWFEVFVYV